MLNCSVRATTESRDLQGGALPEVLPPASLGLYIFCENMAKHSVVVLLARIHCLIIQSSAATSVLILEQVHASGDDESLSAS